MKNKRSLIKTKSCKCTNLTSTAGISLRVLDSAMDPKTGEKRKISKGASAVLCFVFGMEDAQPAREQGRSMAECKYSPQQAHEFLFAQGWDKYHDRFFTRCYVQEGEAAYETAVKAQQKPVDPASTS